MESKDVLLDYRLDACKTCKQHFPFKQLDLGYCPDCRKALYEEGQREWNMRKAGEALGIKLKEEKEAVDHPAHYNVGKLEVIEVLNDWGMLNDFCLGNAIKYIARARHKGKFTEDLKKAIWYLQYAIGEKGE